MGTSSQASKGHVKGGGFEWTSKGGYAKGNVDELKDKLKIVTERLKDMWGHLAQAVLREPLQRPSTMGKIS